MTQHRQIIAGKAVHRAGQHLGKLYIQHRVCQHRQIGKDDLYLSCLQQVLILGAARPNAPFQQGIYVDLIAVFGVPHQNTNISRSYRSARAVLLYRKTLPQQPYDFPCHLGSLGAAVVIGTGRAVSCNNHRRHRSRYSVIIRQRSHQLVLRQVFHAGSSLCHNLPEQPVDKACDLPAGAEVGVQRYLGRKHLVVHRKIIGTLFQKVFGACLTEAVNALLDIAHHKAARPACRQRSENLLLQKAGVLIFVQHDLGIAASQRLCQCRRRSVRLYQQRQGIVLQIAVIQSSALPLGSNIAGVKFQHQLPQPFHQRRKRRLVGTVLRCVHQVNIGFQLPYHNHRRPAQLPDLFLGCKVDPFFTGEIRKARLQNPLGLGIPVVLRNALHQALQHGKVVPQQRADDIPQQLVLASCQKRPAFSDEIDGMLQGLRGGKPQHVAPRRFLQRRFGVGFNVLLRPAAVKGVVAQKVVKLQKRLRHPIVAAAAGKQLHEPHEVRIAFFVLLVQQRLQHRRLYQFIFSLPAQLHIAGQPQLLKILPDQPVAEGMYRANFGIAQQKALAAQCPIFRLLLHLFIQPLGNTLPHLLCSGIGKGHNEQPVNIHRRFPVGNEVQHALGQHGGFSAACRRRHQQITAPCTDRLALRSCPFSLAHCPSSSPPSSLWQPSGLLLLQSPA